MKRIIATLTLIFCSTAVMPHINSFEQYAQQRAALRAKLGDMGRAPQTSVPGQMLSAPLPRSSTPDPFSQLPSLQAPDKMSAPHRQALEHFVQKIAQKHGNQAAMIIMKRTLSSPQRLRSVLTLLETKPHSMDALVGDIDSLKQLMKDPSKLLYDEAESEQPVTRPLLERVMGLRQMFSISEWSGMLRGFIGNTFRQLWHQIWRLVGTTLTTVIGKNNIYELNQDGSYKTDKRGNKQPKMIEEQTINDMGQPEVRMTPNKWFNIVENERALLGQIAQTGIDKATKSTLKSLDRLMFRPIVSRMLDMPEWKLSHTQYLLYTHERQYPNESIINPGRLAERVLNNRNPQLMFVSGLPFPLRRILQIKDPHEKHKALQVAISKHIWKEYRSVWKETAYGGLNSTEGKEIIPESKRKKNITKARSILTEVGQEAKKVAEDSLRAKLQGGPLMQYVIYANLAMGIPRTLFSSFGTGKKLPTSIDKDKDKIGDELIGMDDRELLQAIDLLEAITRKIRQHRERAHNPDSTTVDNMQITIQGTDGSHTIALAPVTQRRLMLAQEKLVQKYQPFMGSTLTGEPYEVYIKRLLMPRLIMKFTPESVRTHFGIKNLADAAKQAKTLERYFDRSFVVLTTLNDLLAMIKKFEGMDTFTGHYVEVADTLDRFLLSLSMLGKAFDVKKDDWGKRVKVLARKTYGKKWGQRHEKSRDSWPYSWLYMGDEKLFTATQRQLIQRAMSKAKVRDLGVLLLDNGNDIKEYIEKGTGKHKLANTFKIKGHGKKTGKEIADKFNLGDVDRTSRVQQGRFRSDALGKEGITNRLTIHQLKTWVNDTKFVNRVQDKLPDIEKNSEVAKRATEVILQTLSLMSVHKDLREDEFFTDGTSETANNATKADSKIKGMQKDLRDKVWLTLSHLRAGIEAASSLYNDFGLREILEAFDEHYDATGEKMTTLPLKLVGKIALREGMAHAVGMGADTLLNKALAPLMNQITRLQGNALLGGPAVQRILMGKVGQIIGGRGGRGNAYHAARELVRNVFTYGSAALKPENMAGTAMTKFMPSMAGPQGEQAAMMIHAKMAAESGRSPLPAISKKLKAMGIDPAMMAQMGLGMGDDDGEMPEMPGMPGGMGGAPPISPQLQNIMVKASQLAQTSGQDAAMAFLQEQMKTLSEQDRAILAQLIGVAPQG